MTDAPLLQPEEPAPRAANRSRLAVAVVAVVVVVLAAGGWWYLNGRQTIPDWERLATLDLVAPAGDAFAADTPWVRLQLAADDTAGAIPFRVSIDTARGAPVPAPRIVGISSEHLGSGEAIPVSLPASPSAGDQTLLLRSNEAGWWRWSVEVAGAAEPATFTLLVPDPNLNGPNAIPTTSSSPEAEAVYRRGLAAMTALRSVRFTQWIADGKGNTGVAEHTVTAGDGDSPPAFSFRALDGLEAIVIGETRWIKRPGAPDWQRQEGAQVVLPAEWGEEYSGATGFTLLGEETIAGERCQLVAFTAPELTEPRRRTVAWYLWWVGAESGQVRRETMVSRVHYMRNDFTDFDAPIVIAAPETAATPVAGTPGG
jgi:hypothetical protein